MNSSLDLKTHNSNRISIKDLDHDLDIGEGKWNFLFDFLLDQSNAIYFNGNRLYFSDDEFENTIDYVSEEIYIDERRLEKLIFRAKPSSLLFNRILFNSVWQYFEYPALIFLRDKSHEEELLLMCEHESYFMDMVNKIPGVYILYRGIEQNVLWIGHSVNEPQIPFR